MTKLIQIGSSYGIRIPKLLIEKANLRNSVIDLQIVEEGLLLK
ncbi:AbrB/MazE/SpoVT family DNA-binding domain-containing protein, partial [Campylobacter helveticus]